ncbi:zinc ribbon domain-containing protein [Planotetraspora silvatica]|nr:zinc ribbon domain-containing protein [Planotetraspora silvatica]
MNCISCGTSNPPGARFCANPGCGAYLSWSGQAPAEERQPQTSLRPQAGGKTGMRMELDVTDLAAEPGTGAHARATVHNTGTRVERFALTVTGTAARWAAVDPGELTVYPGDAATATVTFTPPRSPAGPAGTWDFVVAAASMVSGGLRDDVPGRLTIGRFHALKAVLSPAASRGGVRTRHSLMLENQGNAPEDLRLGATDAENELRIGLPAQVRLDPGRATVPVEVGAAPATFGMPKRVPFTVVVTPAGEPPVTVEGTRIVTPRFGRWPLIVAPVLVVALVAGVLALTRSSTGPPATAGAGSTAAADGGDGGSDTTATEKATEEGTKKAENSAAPGGGAKPTPKATVKKTQKPVTPPAYVAGKGELTGGVAEVAVRNLASGTRIFLTPDLTAITMAGTTIGDDRPRTGGNFPAAALRVTGREKSSFQVGPVTGDSPDGLRFSYLVVDRQRGTLGGLPYEAGSARIGTGQQRVQVSGIETATPDSVIILTVREGGQAVRIDDKEQGGFIASTLDASAATAEVAFDYLVVDPAGDGKGQAKAAAGLARTVPGNVGVAAPRLEHDVIGPRSAVLLTPDATSYRDDAGLYASALTDVCVLSQGDGFAEVEPFYTRRPFVKIPYDWLVVT